MKTFILFAAVSFITLWCGLTTDIKEADTLESLPVYVVDEIKANAEECQSNHGLYVEYMKNKAHYDSMM